MTQYEATIRTCGTQFTHYIWAWSENEAYDRAEEIAEMEYEEDPWREIEVVEV